MLLSLLLSLLPLNIAALASAPANYEPPDGRAYLSFWVDPQDLRDTPRLLNARTRRLMSGFELEQYIPIQLDPYGARKTANLSFIEETGTDAFMFLTVYPDQDAGFDGIKDADIEDLAQQLYELTMQSKRRVLLRYIPENGNWYPSYLGQPIRFKVEWSRLRKAVLAKTTMVDFVWSPNLGYGYPYGKSVPCTRGPYRNRTECEALDTNGDGRVDVKDDAYSPFYPGDDETEWVGLSIYWKGSDVNLPSNIVCNDDPFGDLITGGSSNFYKTYCVDKNKPFAVGESGAAFGLSLGGVDISKVGATQLDIEQSCWRTFLTSPAFFANYTKVKYINYFEFKKVENTTGNGDIVRDFRITTDDTLREAFLADLDAFDAQSNIYLYANYTNSSSAPVAAPAPTELTALLSRTADTPSSPTVFLTLTSTIVMRDNSQGSGAGNGRERWLWFWGAAVLIVFAYLL